MHDQIQCILLHIHRLDTISRFEDLNYIFKSDIHLQVLLAKCLLMSANAKNIYESPKPYYIMKYIKSNLKLQQQTKPAFYYW